MSFSKTELREIESLVCRSQKGDADAFGALYDKFAILIYRYIYYRVSRHEAEDLTEMTFLRAWEKISKYKKQKGASFNSWIYRIAHNAIVDHYRTNSKMTTTELSDDLPELKTSSDPIRNLENKFERQGLIRALKKLPELQQQVVVLKFVNDLDNSEIAQIIDKSVGAVRVIQFRALSRLKTLLNSDEKKSNKTTQLSFKTAENV